VAAAHRLIGFYYLVTAIVAKFSRVDAHVNTGVSEPEEDKDTEQALVRTDNLLPYFEDEMFL
jgi:hypothetical protein